jgi:predicted RNase H-like nuclease
MLLPDAAAIVAVPTDVTAVDIPMGLVEAGVRRCDVEARALLGPARSSVFAAPVRPVLACRTYPEALEVLRGRGGGLMSAQAFGIVPRVRDMDTALRPQVQERIVEVHPEISFRRLAGTATMTSKKTTAGVDARTAALGRWLPDIDQVLAAAPPRVPVDDALDALACAWSATQVRGGAVERLGGSDRDGRGLLMQIVVPRPAGP